MTWQIAQIWRHPIKAVGRERVAQARLTPGACLPFDRHWAIAHQASRIEGDGWAHCRNFIRAAGSPALMAVECRLDETSGNLTLFHPDQDSITVNPDHNSDALCAWLAPLVAQGRPAPTHVHRADRGLTDSETGMITIASLASHRALEDRLGHSLSMDRWRANIWLDGPDAWEEFTWLGKTLRLGEAELEILSRTERCRATESNPATGIRDTDTLGLLSQLGHKDFSVKARVIKGGAIHDGAQAEIL